jgi:uncharacterized UBP type Zn finger protein
MKPEAVHTINDALQQLSQPQTVQVTSPTRAGQTVDAQQTVLIDSLPSILVLHLKRFMYDTNVKDVVKIGKKVAFERELEIAPGGSYICHFLVFLLTKNRDDGTLVKKDRPTYQVQALRRYVLTCFIPYELF